MGKLSNHIVFLCVSVDMLLKMYIYLILICMFCNEMFGKSRVNVTSPLTRYEQTSRLC